MKKILIATSLSVLLAGCAPTAGRVSVAVAIGSPPPPPRAYVVVAQPGPDFVWIEGYWYAQGNRWRWHNGYWTRPPYQGAYWVEPYYIRGYFYAGHWEGGRGRIDHDHRSDERRERDENRGRR